MTDWTAWVTATVAVVGLPYTYWSMRRGELAKAIEELELQIRELEDKGVRYWNLPPGHSDVQSLEMSIKSLSRRVGIQIPKLEKRYRAFRFTRYDFITALRAAVTGSPFEVKGRPAIPRRALDINRLADNLIDEVRDSHRLL